MAGDDPSRSAIEATRRAHAHAVELRRDFAVTAWMLAETEDKVARHHDALAAQWPGRAAEYRRIAKQARDEATRARKVARDFGD